jgi:hypothetical protein
MTKDANANNASVAMQQKSRRTISKYANLTPDQLHQETLSARDVFFEKCVGAQSYAIDVLLPYCQEIIRRYKMQGVAAKARPNGMPTVDAYFKSIGLNYNNVRSWIHRKKLQTEMFQSKQSKSWNRNGETPHLTQLEAKLLGTASAGHDLVKAIKRGGNVDEAIKEFEDHAPTPERIEEYIERPTKVAVTEVEKLAIRLCKLIDQNDGKHEQEILALARELLTKVEPTAAQQVPAGKNKRQRRDARGKVSAQHEKTMVPPLQPTNGVEISAQ